jgi:hypothetical protein
MLHRIRLSHCHSKSHCPVHVPPTSRRPWRPPSRQPLALVGQGNRRPSPMLAFDNDIASHPSYNGCTYPPRMPTSPRRSARPNPASCFSYRHLDSLKASTARCTSDRSINFSHARLPDGHTSFSTCLSSLDAQPPFGYLRPTPHTHLTSSRRLSSM